MSYANPKLKSTHAPEEAIQIMAAGSLAAETVLSRVRANGYIIDPKNHHGGGRAPFYLLDNFDIYGDRIVHLYKDVAKENMVDFLAMLRAVETGIYSASALNAAINERKIDPEKVAELTIQVQELIPSFGKHANKQDLEKELVTHLTGLLGKSLIETITQRNKAAQASSTVSDMPGDLEAQLNAVLEAILPDNVQSKVTVIDVSAIKSMATAANNSH